MVTKILIFTGLYLQKSFRNLPLEKHPLKNLPYAAWRGKHLKQLKSFIRQRYRTTSVLNVSAGRFSCLCSPKAAQNWQSDTIPYSWFLNYPLQSSCVQDSPDIPISQAFSWLLSHPSTVCSFLCPLLPLLTILPKLSVGSKRGDWCYYFQKHFVEGEHSGKCMGSYWGCFVPDCGPRCSTKL